jgi:hypothetical protein
MGKYTRGFDAGLKVAGKLRFFDRLKAFGAGIGLTTAGAAGYEVHKALTPTTKPDAAKNPATDPAQSNVNPLKAAGEGAGGVFTQIYDTLGLGSLGGAFGPASLLGPVVGLIVGLFNPMAGIAVAIAGLLGGQTLFNAIKDSNKPADPAVTANATPAANAVEAKPPVASASVRVEAPVTPPLAKPAVNATTPTPSR